MSQSSFEYETVEKIMLKDPIKINENKQAREVFELMNKTKVDDILVVDNDNVLKGRVDLHTLTQNRNPQAKIKDIMKKVTFVVNTTSIRDSIYYVRDLGYRNLSVVDKNGKLVGLVTRSSIVSEVYDVFWKEYEPVVENELAIPLDQKVQAAVDLISNNGEEGPDAKWIL